MVLPTTYYHDVRDLNVHLKKQLAVSGQRWLADGRWELTLDDLIYYWYRVELEESLAIFYTRHRLYERYGASLYNQCIKGTDPSLVRWLRRIVTVPPHLLSIEPLGITVDETDLAILYNPGEKLDDHHHSLYRKCDQPLNRRHPDILF